jgi:tetratricopeptide (TPR) repeat protein
MNMTIDPLPVEYEKGRLAFESGNYRQAIHSLEAAMAEIEPRSALGGEVQLWLVTAYEAGGLQPEAIDLCTKLTRHPQIEVRQESKRVLYILQAPALSRKEEWITKIPDLQDLEENVKGDRIASRKQARSIPIRKLPPPPLIDPKEINTKDNGFIAILLFASLAGILGLLWAGVN